MKVLLGITGSVATTVTPKLITTLRNNGHEVTVISTDAACYFTELQALGVQCFTDRDEWPGVQYQRGQLVPHIEMRRWADVGLIAPLSANTLAKIAGGFADNMLTCVMRAWDVARPLVVAPAMNTMMWEHPATAYHLEQLGRWYSRLAIVPPTAKVLACGDEGVGAMADVSSIVEVVNQH